MPAASPFQRTSCYPSPGNFIPRRWSNFRGDCLTVFRMHRRVPLLLLALALACGRKTIVKAPELVAPARIDNLTAANAVEGIQLSWRRPERYADGSQMYDLGSFHVERGVGLEVFAPVHTVEVTDRERFQQERRFGWTDTDTVLGQTYRYRVVSETTDGYVSQPSNVAILERAQPSPTPSPARTPTPR